MIRFKDVTKEYGNENALKDLSLTINSGELFVLVGPSGSGKTTLLKMVNRLISPTSGRVFIDDDDVATVDVQDLRRHTGYVLQTGALFPNMTVEQNASVQLEALGWDADKQHQRISELLSRVDLDPSVFLARKPSELSGGEAQRVGIVRALAANPKLILMDEPFSALDPLSKRQLQNLILKLHHELPTTFIFVTHDMQEAIKLADRLAVIHDGTLQQLGTPNDILASPANEFVRDFFDDGQSRKQFMKQVLTAGYGRPVQTADEVTVLKDENTIFDWAEVVAETPEMLVQVNQQVLTGADLIAYMSTLG